MTIISKAERARISALHADTLELNGTALTATAAELNRVAGQLGYPVQAAEVTFAETDGAGTYTGAVALPAGATIHDIIINGVALWDNAGAVTMKVGDTDDDGFYPAGGRKPLVRPRGRQGRRVHRQ